MTIKVRYQVTHETHYKYAFPVTLSQQLLHLQPREMPYQSTISQNVQIVPLPNETFATLDSFANPCLQLEFNQPHSSLKVIANMTIDAGKPFSAVIVSLVTIGASLRFNFLNLLNLDFLSVIARTPVLRFFPSIESRSRGPVFYVY